MHLVLVATTTIVAAKLLIVDMDHTAGMEMVASVSQGKEAIAGSNLLVATLARRLTGTNPLHLLLGAVGTSRLVVTAFGKGALSWI
jgi:hypothetical protein